MKITTRLTLILLLISLLPVAAVGFTGLLSMNRVSDLALGESTTALQELGEAAIHQKALDIAQQIDLYLQAHPEVVDLPLEEWPLDQELLAIGVQPVGETGYTAVFDSTGITYLHVNPNVAGSDMHSLADSFPEFWGIFEASLDGELSSGYYDWEDADGIIREKYMVCAPVGDTRWRVAATTYIDEFYQPILTTQSKIDSTTRDTQWLLFGVLALVALTSVAVAVLLARYTIRPLNEISESAKKLREGQLGHKIVINTQDEIGELATTFNEMAASIQHRTTALRQLNESLEQRVKDRTAELEVATAEAREASRLKDEFLSVMSHELRTPLNAILGYQGLMELMGELDGENLNMVQRTQANARRLLNLINDVLDISRIEAGRMEMVSSELVVENLVDQIASQMKVLAEEKELEFNVSIGEAVPTAIYYDEDALTKIMVNLLGNAFKFTDEGQVDLNLSANNGTLTIAVNDTGVGIPTHMQEIIFERFRQADSTSTRVHGGSGLGLSIVQQLAQTMGGRVVVQSEPEVGSTFTVTLPLQTVPEVMEVTT